MDLRYTVLLQPIATDTIFAPANAISVRGNLSGEGSNQDYRCAPQLHRPGFDRLALQSLSQFQHHSLRRIFAFACNECGPELRAASAEYPEEIRATYLQLPRLDPRIPELARQITARALTPFDKTIRMENYLRIRFTYTLDSHRKTRVTIRSHIFFLRLAPATASISHPRWPSCCARSGFPRGKSMDFCRASTTISAGTTSSAPAMRTAGSKSIFPGQAG